MTKTVFYVSSHRPYLWNWKCEMEAVLQYVETSGRGLLSRYVKTSDVVRILKHVENCRLRPYFHTRNGGRVFNYVKTLGDGHIFRHVETSGVDRNLRRRLYFKTCRKLWGRPYFWACANLRGKSYFQACGNSTWKLYFRLSRYQKCWPYFHTPRNLR